MHVHVHATDLAEVGLEFGFDREQAVRELHVDGPPEQHLKQSTQLQRETTLCGDVRKRAVSTVYTPLHSFTPVK